MFLIPNPDRHYGCRVNDRITWQGMRALLLQNELLQIVVLVDKGSEIIQFLYKPLDIDFLWHAPRPLHDPRQFTTSAGSPVTPFFDHWAGGWFEVLPNGGTACEIQNAPLGFFAETTNAPWEMRILDDSPDKVSVGFWFHTYRTPFLIEKILTLKSGIPALFIQERVTNQGCEPVEFMWGHHPVVGAPFLDETCRISAPPCTVEVFHAEDGPDHRMGLHQSAQWPFIQNRHGLPLDLRDVPPPSGRTMDNCYLKDFQEGWISVQSKRQNVGFGLAWDANVFRYIWLWQALGGGLGYPWYGRTGNMGLEPWTSFPCAGLAEAVQRGTAARLQPNQSLEAWLTAVAFTDLFEVSQIARNGQVVGV